MKRFLIFNILMVCLAAVSCREWTTPESLKFEKNSIQKLEPELFKEYCKAVRAYKGSDHKIAYVTYENVSNITNGSQNISMLPDSVDYVQLHNLEIDDKTLNDVKALREMFGTKFILRFSYNECLTAYTILQDTETEETIPEFAEYLHAEFSKVTNKISQYGLDGFTFAYVCGNPYEMTADKLNTLKAEQNLVLPMVSEWITANPELEFFFEGWPQYLLHEDIVPATDYVILPTRNERSVGDLGYKALQAENSGKIEKGTKYLFSVETPSFVEEEYLVGQFVLGEQIPLAAEWVITEASFNKAGLVVWNVQRDYFDTKTIYSSLRSAIKTMNPNE